MKSEVSHKNQYWIPKHRYYELRSFCMQYPDWQKEFRKIQNATYGKEVFVPIKTDGRILYTVAEAVIEMERYVKRIELVESCANACDYSVRECILYCVTHGCSYDALIAKMHVVPEFSKKKNSYNNEYRKFFWLLDKARD